MTGHPDPTEEPWEPASSAWARKQAIEATRAAVTAAREKRKKPPEEQR